MAHLSAVDSEKSRLRAKLKKAREEMNQCDKQSFDEAICEVLLLDVDVKACKQVLCYVSVKNEVSTRELISQLLAQKKCVCVPRCDDKNGNMSFYVISSFDDLQIGAFGLLEPKGNCLKASPESSGVCIVPALAFDKTGNRLGYGGGYYDRFLVNYGGTKIGICYENEVLSVLQKGSFDIAVDKIITQNCTITVAENGV